MFPPRRGSGRFKPASNDGPGPTTLAVPTTPNHATLKASRFNDGAKHLLQSPVSEKKNLMKTKPCDTKAVSSLYRTLVCEVTFLAFFKLTFCSFRKTGELPVSPTLVLFSVSAKIRSTSLIGSVSRICMVFNTCRRFIEQGSGENDECL